MMVEDVPSLNKIPPIHKKSVYRLVDGRSEYGTIFYSFPHRSQLLLDDGFGFGDIIEGNLGEQMMLTFILHPHQNYQPGPTLIWVVAGCGKLLIDKLISNFVIISFLSFVVACKQ